MLQLNPAIINLDTQNSEKKNSNKTLKNKKSVNFSMDSTNNDKKKINSMNGLLSKLYDDNDEDDDSNNYINNLFASENNNSDELNNEIKKLQEKRNLERSFKEEDVVQGDIHNQNKNSNKNLLSNNLEDSYNLDYKSLSEKLNFSTNNSITLEDNNRLLNKLDYIINLLEEQHNEKTDNVNEELILYLFLGIFIIFVLDSFTKASKYIR